MKTAQIYQLESHTPDGARHYIGDRVDARALAESRTAWVTITRTGKFFDPRYGEFEITRDMLLSMVKNFDANVYGQRIALDVAHNPSEGAAGYFVKLEVTGNKLRGEVDFTDYGLDAVNKRGMIYLSAEFHDNYQDNEQRKNHGPTLLGAALTARPVIKRLDPVQLSDDALAGAPPTYIDTRISKLLSDEGTQVMKKLLEELRAKLASFNLAEAIIAQLLSTFEAVAQPLAEETMQRTLMSEFVTTGEALAKQLAESGNTGTVKLDFGGLEKALAAMKPAATGLSADDVKKLFEEQTAAQAQSAKQLQEKRDANLKLFNEKLDAAEGLKALSEEQMKIVRSAAELITPELSAEQVTKLAEMQITVGNQFAVGQQLANMGYGGTGRVHIEHNENNEIVSLQETINQHLRKTSLYGQKKLRLAEQGKEHPFVAEVLAIFDTLHAPRLLAEHKRLSGGNVDIGDTSLPVGFQRTVIREALSDLRVLTLINTLTDPSATVTTQIPYETRDVSAIYNNGIVYEGQPIHEGGISQAMDTAYIVPMKIAMLVSNEVMHFTRMSQINWDAYARNVESNARFARELIVRRICNELQRSADAYAATAVTGEAFDTQLDGATSVLKTTNFPIVRPHQNRDLQGTAVGSAENAIALVLNGTALEEYDGTGTQSAGTYYTVTNYNLGYIQLVDESGDPVTPADSGTNTLGYSYATNVTKFDLDNGSVELATHLDGLLRAVGARKAVMNGDRYVTPDFQLMSPVLNNTASNARSFEAQAKRSGSDTNNDGDLEMIRAIPAFSTNAPGVDLGDERILLGQRGVMTYTIAKPFITGEPFEAIDVTTGKPIGKKRAYGEEYSAIKVPTPIRNRLTSVIAYSDSGR